MLDGPTSCDKTGTPTPSTPSCVTLELSLVLPLPARPQPPQDKNAVPSLPFLFPLFLFLSGFGTSS